MLKLALIIMTGSTTEGRAAGLSVILGKIAGVAFVAKLCALLLIEADLNYHSRLIFGKLMMDLARKYNMVPEETYSEKGKMTEDAIL